MYFGVEVAAADFDEANFRLALATLLEIQPRHIALVISRVEGGYSGAPGTGTRRAQARALALPSPHHHDHQDQERDRPHRTSSGARGAVRARSLQQQPEAAAPVANASDVLRVDAVITTRSDTEAHAVIDKLNTRTSAAASVSALSSALGSDVTVIEPPHAPRLEPSRPPAPPPPPLPTTPITKPTDLPSTDESSSGGGGADGGAIALAIWIVVFVVLAVGLFVLWRRNRAKSAKPKAKHVANAMYADAISSKAVGRHPGSAADLEGAGGAPAAAAAAPPQSPHGGDCEASTPLRHQMSWLEGKLSQPSPSTPALTTPSNSARSAAAAMTLGAAQGPGLAASNGAAGAGGGGSPTGTPGVSPSTPQVDQAVDPTQASGASGRV